MWTCPAAPPSIPGSAPACACLKDDHSRLARSSDSIRPAVSGSVRVLQVARRRSRVTPSEYLERAFQNERTAKKKDRPKSIRRNARRHAQADIERVQAAEQRLAKLLRAEERKLTGALDRADQMAADISHEVSERERWMEEHPKATTQLTAQEKKLREVEHENDHERGPSKESSIPDRRR